MHTITFFATKGGTGRTVSTMALASGFLALGKRVLVLDCTDEAKAGPRRENPSTLQRWRTAMSTSGVQEDRLQLLDCITREDVEDMLASADTDGFDIALIDTRILPQEPQGEPPRLYRRVKHSEGEPYDEEKTYPRLSS